MNIATIAFLVRDYEEAISWFTEKLGFALMGDTQISAEKRWVVVVPQGGAGAALVLAKAASPAQRARIGNQAAGRVFLFLETDDFDLDFAAMTARGVKFLEAPRNEPYGKVAVFEDLYGAKWDLIGRK